MKKVVLTILFSAIGVIAWAQTKKDSPQDKPQQEQKETPEAKKAAENDFQERKAQEAKEKQEAKRKAMKERAKNKQEIEKSK